MMLRSALYKAFNTMFMFLAGLVLSNIVLPGHFGTVSLLIVNASLFSIITGLGTDGVIMYMLANNKWNMGQAKVFVWKALLLQMALFAAFEGFTCAVWNITLLSLEGVNFIWIDVTYFLGILLLEKFTTLLYAAHKARMANIAISVISAIYLLMLISIRYFLAVSFYSVLFLFGAQSLLQGGLLLLLFIVKVPAIKNQHLNKKDLKDAFRWSIIVMITNVLQFIAYRVDFLLLKNYFGNYHVGLYAQANKFANLVWIIPNIFAQLLIPRFAFLKDKEISLIFRTAIYLNILIVVFTVACTYAFYYFYLDKQYIPGIYSFFIMMPGYFFWAAVVYFGAYFSWRGKFMYNLACSTGCFVLIIIADLFLIPRYGINGAGMANTLVYTTIFCCYLALLSFKSSFHLKELLLPRRTDFSNFWKFLLK